jgi:K+-sensing histidine kinase KdpD
MILPLEGELQNLPLDQKLIERALNYLLSNAVKYSVAGSDIQFSAQRQADRLQITIRDGASLSPSKSRRACLNPAFAAAMSAPSKVTAWAFELSGSPSICMKAVSL